MEIAEGIWKIGGDSNVYLILGDVPIVVDAGNVVDKEFVKSEIEKVISLDKIRGVLLTHLHYDHIGCVDLFPNAEIYADAEEIEGYKNNSKEFFFYVSEEVDRVLLEKLRPLGKEVNGLRVVRVPGHTGGSVAFLDEGRKLLFSGDTIFEKGIGRTDLPNSIPDEMKESVEKLIGLIDEGDLVLCPGHDY